MRIFAGFIIVSCLLVLGGAGGHSQGHWLGGDSARPGLSAAVSAISDRQHFTVSITALASPVELNAMHAWILRIRARGGWPIEDATVSIVGSNPDRGHGLPTAPRVTKYLGDGDYLAEGVKFHMAGDWRLKFAISAGGLRDTASFNIVVK